MKFIFSSLTLACILLVGCGQPTQPSTNSSLDKKQTERVAGAAAYAIGGTVCRIADTGSMEPVLNGNSYVVIEKCAVKDVGLGDIVAFTQSDGRHIVHRVIDTGTELRTRGDANNYTDSEAVTTSNIMGRVVVIVYGKKPAN
jgi:signal peptidase I